MKTKIIIITAIVSIASSLVIGTYVARGATIRVQGSSVAEEMLREAQAQTKSLDRIAKALEVIAKR